VFAQQRTQERILVSLCVERAKQDDVGHDF
jgi:hypothetical protein